MSLFKPGQVCKLLFGDCLQVMGRIPDGSVDLIACDLPYGTTACKWDTVIPFAPLWAHYRRIIKPRGAIVLTASQPFTSALVMSNPKWFRCEWVWNKVHATNFANAKRQPLKVHESVVVFAKSQPTYFPQRTKGRSNHAQGKSTINKSGTRKIDGRAPDDLSGMKYPQSILTFPKHSSQCGLHETQKPVDLFEYLIRTYSNEGETVLDNTMGSGTTGVACLNIGRRFIGIENDPDIYRVAATRIGETYRGLK